MLWCSYSYYDYTLRLQEVNTSIQLSSVIILIVKADLKETFLNSLRELCNCKGESQVRNMLRGMRFQFTHGWQIQLAMHSCYPILTISTRPDVNRFNLLMQHGSPLCQSTLAMSLWVWRVCEWKDNHWKNWRIENILVPVAILLQKNPTTRHRTQEVSQRVNMAAREGDHATRSPTAPQSQRAAPSRRVGQQDPNHSSPLRRSKTSLLERRSDWQMWRR